MMYTHRIKLLIGFLVLMSWMPVFAQHPLADPEMQEVRRLTLNWIQDVYRVLDEAQAGQSMVSEARALQTERLLLQSQIQEMRSSVTEVGTNNMSSSDFDRVSYLYSLLGVLNAGRLVLTYAEVEDVTSPNFNVRLDIFTLKQDYSDLLARVIGQD